MDNPHLKTFTFTTIQERPLYEAYVLEVNFDEGGNRSARRKPSKSSWDRLKLNPHTTFVVEVEDVIDVHNASLTSQKQGKFVQKGSRSHKFKGKFILVSSSAMQAVMHAVIFLCCFVFNSRVKTTPGSTYLFLVNVSRTTECKLVVTFCCCELLFKIGKLVLDQARVNLKCITIAQGILGIFLSPTNSCLHICMCQ